MLKKGIRLLGVVAIVCMLFSGCGMTKQSSNVEDYYDNSKNIKANISSNYFGLDVVLLTKKKVDKVEFLTCNGENIDTSKMNVSIINNSLDSYSNIKTNGLYCSDWLLEITFEDNSNYSIKNMTLVVDGVERVLEFDEPLKYNKEEGNDIINEDLYSTIFPCEFPSSIIGTDETVQYEFIADKDCIFNGIRAKDYFDFSEGSYYLNEDNAEQKLPISLKKGDKVYAQVKYNKLKKGVNAYTYLVTNIELLYEVDGKEMVRNGSIVFNPISPMDEENKKLDAFVSYILDK